MKLDFDDAPHNAITSYRGGAVFINGRAFEASLIVTPTQIVDDWPAESVDSLSPAAFEMIAALEPEVVLLGTGQRLQFPAPALSRRLLERGIGLECMDTAAACRSYCVLAAEGRRVAAALIIP
jgi:uncharacterized protein